ncbi:MAG: ribonuclease HII [Caldilineaceae bacterium]|nr:ribonuclease HII [Caldilineaceae bacterium]
MHGVPDLQTERRLWTQGFRHVAGIDEAGRGALAGPVVAGAVIVDPDACDAPVWSAVRDSKQLSPAARATLVPQIEAAALAWAVGVVEAAIIDEVGIAPATRLAMRAAVDALVPQPNYLLIDWVRLPLVNIPQQSMAKADQHIVSVAAASILAKVHRDGIMVELGKQYAAYGFASHKGYGAAAHLAALAQCGPSPVHRHSFAPIARPATLFDLP